MGNRKERRHAAHSATGRRVKLDLFAEPSGQGPGNPLLLLGQYSDDEMDEETSDGVNDAILENTTSNLDDQVKDSGGEENEETAPNTGHDVTEQKVAQENLESLSASADTFLEGNDAAGSGDLHRETNMTGRISIPGTYDTQANEDVSSDWKMVLHEESNSYYYWNIVTGETSWVAPDILSQGTESGLERNTALETEERKVALPDTQIATSVVDVGMDDAVDSHLDSVSAHEDNENNDSISEEEVHKEIDGSDVQDQKGKDNDVSEIDAEMRTVPVNVNHGIPLPGDYMSSKQSDDTLLGSANKGCAGSATQNVVDFEQQQSTSDLSSNLVRHGEYLLGRLKSLRGSNGRDCEIAKLIFAVEIRLHDMRSLGSYGSSLLPFWLHSESQLKELEATIDDEVLKFCESAKIGEDSAVCKSDEIINDDANTVAKRAVSTSGDLDTFAYLSSCWDHREYLSKNPVIHTSNVQTVAYNNSPFDGDGRGIALASGTGAPSEAKTELQTEDDDTDMDVEMEVEDSVIATNTVEETTQYGALLENSMLPQPQPLPPAEHESPLEEGKIPPPPDDGWIPPPPPDDEPIPPPPPDEPPESAPLRLSEFQAVQQFSYAGHYNVPYTGSGLEYYGQTSTEVPSSSYYVDANGYQVAASLPQLYYALVPNTYSTAASGLVNPVEPVAYYAFQNEAGFTPVSSSSVGNEREDVSLEAHPFPASVQAPVTSPMTYGVPVISNPAVTATIASKETIPKFQSKASRTKKQEVSVVSSLMSNKKVSGLVDKWKAAKEEMHEDEDLEPEDPYERLEKKRQREIEEWHAQQIASGEAKDNANFQPLGADWRERVKRKRAKMMSEAAQTSPQVLDEGNQQPDLNEVSRDLPSGWLAYWDESSKQFYYGNSVTSETTWIRPTN